MVPICSGYRAASKAKRRNKPLTVRMGSLVLSVLFLLLIPGLAAGDVIYLKSGGKIEGVISSETTTEVVIKTHGGLLTIERSKIKKLVRAEEKGNSELIEKQKAAEEAEAARPPAVKPEEGARPERPPSRGETLDVDLLGELSKDPVALTGAGLTLKLKTPAHWILRRDEASRSTQAIRPESSGSPRARLLLWTMEVGRRTLGQSQGLFVQAVKDAYKLESPPPPKSITIGGRMGIEVQFDSPDRGSIRALLVETGAHGKLGLILECDRGSVSKFDRALNASVASLQIESP